MENNDIIKDARSVKRCAASVATAKLLARIPPTTSTTMKTRQSIEAIISFLLAFLSIPLSLSV